MQKFKLKSVLFVLAIVTLPLLAKADELILSSAELGAQGFQHAENRFGLSQFGLTTTPVLDHANPLPWPIAFADAHHSMGNVMEQYQNYGGGAYFHGGSDLRAQAGSSVRTPVAGQLAGCHYAFKTNPDGSMEKFIKPWPQSGEDAYFEISITTADGYRFEFHHVDPGNLPSAVVQLLDHGGGFVAAGTEVGHVLTWPVAGVDGEFYHHIHYNIHAPDGHLLNPQYYSTSIENHLPPVIHSVYAIDEHGGVTEYKGGQLQARPVEFVVAVTDKIAGNVYTHTPARVRLHFASGLESGWDFRQQLVQANGLFPAIWNVFVENLVLPNGQTLSTQGDYDNNFFLMRLPVPPSASGAFTIEVSDVSDLSSQLGGQI
jgi:hypothetical protein